MKRGGSQAAIHPLAQAEGVALLSGGQVIIKAALETDREIALIAGPRHDTFAGLFAATSEEAVATLLRQHRLNIKLVSDASRAITLASQAAQSGHVAAALVPNDQLDVCMNVLAQLRGRLLHKSGAMCVLLEDEPQSSEVCPRQVVMRLNLPCIEPADLGDLREAIDHALRLSRAGDTPAAVVVHASLLRSTQTLEVQPNRRASTIDLVLARQRRKPRLAEAAVGRDVMRLARRMELNRARAIPNPGERVPIGFIAVGPSDQAITYVADALDLHGRLPVLQLGLLNPIDDVAVSRLLSRCERVVVLEPRPDAGTVEGAVLRVAERMRQGGSEPARVWGRHLPPDESGVSQRLEKNEALHPSTLARRIVHLLHAVRPTMKIAQRLAPDPPPIPLVKPSFKRRGGKIGAAAAIGMLRRMAADVDQWLRSQTAQSDERLIEPTALAIDGIEPVAVAKTDVRIVPVEFWSGQSFLERGAPALRQAAREDGGWVMFVCGFDVPDNQDMERLARGLIPEERADRVTVGVVNLQDRTGLRTQLEQAATRNGLTVLILQDRPVARYDVAKIEREMATIDRAGFEPRQRLVWPADEACLLARKDEDDVEERVVTLDVEAVRTEVQMDRSTAARGGIRFHVRPLLEQIEVVRTNPPAWAWLSAFPASGASTRLELPTPIHRSQPLWRAHMAGFRGPGPGVAATVLQEAGFTMGYDVASIHDPSPIGPGRRGWAQLVFTRRWVSEPKAGSAHSAAETIGNQTPQPHRIRLLAAAPYGEVDLLIGFDAQETLRAIGPGGALRIAQQGRTCAVVNAGAFGDEEDGDHAFSAIDAYRSSIEAVCRPDQCIVDDFASISRTWFYTDRIADLVMLGAAYQRGLVPLTLEALELALRRIEAHGFGRSLEAFTFGRHLALHPRHLQRRRNEHEEDTGLLIRRLALGLRARRWGGGAAARRFHSLVHRSLASMPGLAETGSGRKAQLDFITGVYRAIEWGGFDEATRFADAITSLYNTDRGETGRALTRCAVLPLADAMLIHDPIYIATMAMNPERRRQLRERLNVKHARGDHIERRYLTRVEIAAFGRRFRADVRTSDWPARLARALRHIWPVRWRGSRREREIRQFVFNFTQRAAYAAKQEYPQWSEAMHRLHLQAAENRLRGMAMAELRMLAEPGERSSA